MKTSTKRDTTSKSRGPEGPPFGPARGARTDAMVEHGAERRAQTIAAVPSRATVTACLDAWEGEPLPIGEKACHAKCRGVGEHDAHAEALVRRMRRRHRTNAVGATNA